MVVKTTKKCLTRQEEVEILDGVSSVRLRLEFILRLVDERERITQGNENIQQELFEYISEQLHNEVTVLKSIN